MLSALPSSKKRIAGIALCTAFVPSLVSVGVSFAANTDPSPYEYQVYASGTTFTNDYRSKTTSSYVGVTPSTTGYYVSPNAYVPPNRASNPLRNAYLRRLERIRGKHFQLYQ